MTVAVVATILKNNNDVKQMTTTQPQERQRNRFSGNCSECRKHIEAQEGYLFKNTKYRTSKGYHVKCEDCFTGATAKRIREEEKASKGKTLSVNFAKKWCESLQLKHQFIGEYVYCDVKKDPVSCEVYSEGSLILGWADIFEGFQEYPTEEWCQEQASKLGGYFTDNAVSYICEKLAEMIQEKIAEKEILKFIDKDSHPLRLIPLNQVISSSSVERKYIDRALIRLKLLGKIELRTTKTGVAKSLNIEPIDIGGVKYGFLKYNRG